MSEVGMPTKWLPGEYPMYVFVQVWWGLHLPPFGLLFLCL